MPFIQEHSRGSSSFHSNSTHYWDGRWFVLVRFILNNDYSTFNMKGAFRIPLFPNAIVEQASPRHRGCSVLRLL